MRKTTLTLLFLLFSASSWADVSRDGTSFDFDADESGCETVLPHGLAGIWLNGSVGSGDLDLEMLDTDGTSWIVVRTIDTDQTEVYEVYDFGVEAVTVRLTTSGTTSPTISCRVFPWNQAQR